MYTPPNTQLSSEIKSSKQRRLLLMGPPKWGKTWAALTFPNPIVIDFDRGLTEIKTPVPALPFWDDEWCKKTFASQTKKMNMLTAWLKTEGMKLGEDQTLVFDSLSTISDVLAIELEAATPTNKAGEKDGFWFWKEWSNYLRSLHVLINSLKCNVVMCCHEQEIRDSETGRVTAYKWLLKGQDFSARLGQYYTDVFRQTKLSKENAQDKTVSCEYVWQVQPDNMFQLCCTRIQTNKKFVPATFASFGV